MYTHPLCVDCAGGVVPPGGGEDGQAQFMCTGCGRMADTDSGVLMEERPVARIHPEAGPELTLTEVIPLEAYGLRPRVALEVTSRVNPPGAPQQTFFLSVADAEKVGRELTTWAAKVARRHE